MVAALLLCANHGLSFFINEHCQYFDNDDECKFCSLVPTQKKYNDVLKFKKLGHVEETLGKVIELKDRIDFIQMSGGSLLNHDKEVRSYIPYIKSISQILCQDSNYINIPIHLTCMPPKNLDILIELKEAGLSTISFDLECPTQKYFEKYCPGKSNSYGYDNMINALLEALNVFGQNKVFSIIIAGIEPLDSFVAGTLNLIKRGIVPTINIYHHDPLIKKMDIFELDYRLIISSFQTIAKYYNDFKIRAGLLGCAHYDIGHEFWKGYFNQSISQ